MFTFTSCKECDEAQDKYFLEMTLAMAIRNENIPAIKQLLTLKLDLNWIQRCKRGSHRGFCAMEQLGVCSNPAIIDLLLEHPEFHPDPNFFPLTTFIWGRQEFPSIETHTNRKEREHRLWLNFLHYAFHPRLFHVPDEALGRCLTHKWEWYIRDLKWLLAVGRYFEKKVSIKEFFCYYYQ